MAWGEGHVDADQLQTLADRGGIGILAGHSARESMAAERVTGTVWAARERGIEVTTLHKGAEE